MLVIAAPALPPAPPCEVPCQSLIPNLAIDWLHCPPPHIIVVTRVAPQASAIAITSRNRRSTSGRSFSSAWNVVALVGGFSLPHAGAAITPPAKLPRFFSSSRI